MTSAGGLTAGVAMPLGLCAPILYTLRLANVDRMLASLGARTGPHSAVLEMPFTEAAVDVDKPEDLALVETFFARRGVA